MVRPTKWSPEHNQKFELENEYENLVVWGTSSFAAGTYGVILADLSKPNDNGSASDQYPHGSTTELAIDKFTMTMSATAATQAYAELMYCESIDGGTATWACIASFPLVVSAVGITSKLYSFEGIENTSEYVLAAAGAKRIQNPGPLYAGTMWTAPTVNGTTQAGTGDIGLFFEVVTGVPRRIHASMVYHSH